MSVVPIIFCLLVLLLPRYLIAGETVLLYMPDAPPLTLHDYQGGYGMVGDVTLAAIARSGRLTQLMDEPWPRAQASVIDGKDLLIIPLSRTPDREANYTWIVPIMPLERAFFSLDDPVHSFAEARQRYSRIGVGLGTAQVEMLRRAGFADSQVVQLKLGENPARLLELGRIDAWFTGVPEALYIWSKAGERQSELRMSPVLASTDLYLACSKLCNQKLIAELRKAVLELEAEGVSQRLRQAYLPASFVP
ncbi:substrate-binding periplasmic protein [Pseudomonas sp. NCHU5208]|uniref:substrate-binding periplasmic protein n=1 Tax=unclassified Pseudomonas TaxID=196821 RepID=UPI003F975511